MDQALQVSKESDSGIYSGYFAEARLERDRARSRQKEELRSLAENGDTANAATLLAQEKLVGVINRCELETTLETLIKQRGFADALVYISDTDYIDVIVNASSLSSQQVAVISDIVVRHAQVPMENITVKNVN
ncbi:MAG TPA: SpoIIIAH-like family protein [Thermoclostridium sp.]|nr:SpoIIIAH-like family protein [Thermoclostridium sp.]